MNKQEAEKELITIVTDILNPYNEREVEIEAHFLAEDGWRKVPQAEWIEHRWTTEDDWGCINHRSIECSACKTEINNGELTNHCPHCGAEMVGKRCFYD